MASENDNEADIADEAEDFAESLAVTHHLALLELIDVIGGMEGAPADRLAEIRAALVEVLPPEDIELMQ